MIKPRYLAIIFAGIVLLFAGSLLVRVHGQGQNFTLNGNGTTNLIPKWTGSYTAGNSSITDNGTTVSTTEAVSSGALTVTGAASATGQITTTVATGTAPLAISSTTPVGTLVVSNHPQMQFCGTTVACSHTALTAAQIIFGTAALSSGTPSTAVITGISPAFTSATSYKCFPNDVTTITNAVNVVTYTSGSSFTINGPTTVTDTVAYLCVGN